MIRAQKFRPTALRYKFEKAFILRIRDQRPKTFVCPLCDSCLISAKRTGPPLLEATLPDFSFFSSVLTAHINLIYVATKLENGGRSMLFTGGLCLSSAFPRRTTYLQIMWGPSHNGAPVVEVEEIRLAG